jgi:DNA-binding transcriptional MocR family regulator
MQLEFHNPPNWVNSDIIVTVGSQQGLASVIEMTVSQGDPVLVPEPLYSSALNIVSCFHVSRRI